MISTEPTDSASPAWLASFSGADENPVSASSAKRNILRERIFGLARDAARRGHRASAPA